MHCSPLPSLRFLKSNTTAKPSPTLSRPSRSSSAHARSSRPHVSVQRRYNHTSSNFLSNWKQRGFIANMTATEEVMTQVLEKPTAVYIGFDPTADSLHIGNLLQIMALAHMQRAGHTAIAVVGGATGLIGDPSGRATERQLLTEDTINYNITYIRNTLQRCLSQQHGDNPEKAQQQQQPQPQQQLSFKLVNNYDWYRNMNMISFLRDVGKHFRINAMLTKDSVKGRLTTHEGMSFTEFSYQLMQAYDFYYLHQHHNCTLQMGGSDQWGNITEGCDLISKLAHKTAYGITLPLLTTSTGEKLGKSTGIGGAVWLSSHKTPVYDFYQYWVRVDDADVERYLKLFTFLPLEEISQISAQHNKAPEQRYAQHILAEHVTNFVHGVSETKKAQHVSKLLFGGEGGEPAFTSMKYEDLVLSGFTKNAPTTQVSRDQLVGQSVVTVAALGKLASSNREIRRLIEGGGLYLNGKKVTDKEYKLQGTDIIDNNFCVLRSGKKNYHILLVA